MKTNIPIVRYIKEYFRSRDFFEWIGKFIHLLASIWAASHLFPEKWNNETGLLAIIFYSITLVLVISQNFILYNRVERRDKELEIIIESKNKLEKYANLHKEINNAFLIIHSLNVNNELDDIAHMRSLQHFCTKIAQIFKDIKNSNCNVCIKIIKSKNQTRDSENLEVVTLVRDRYYTNDRDYIDRDKNIVHLLKENYDFYELFKKIGTEYGRYFLHNCLADIPNYTNSSFRYIQGGPGTSTYFPQNTSTEHKKSTWPLKYLSTLVVPIIMDVESLKPEDALIGFICIDSRDEGIFNHEIDPEILIGCSEALYSPINNLLKNESQRTAN